MIDRFQLHAGRFPHVGINRVDARSKTLRLSSLKFRLDVVDHWVAERGFQEMALFEPGDTDHGCVEIITGRLQVLRPQSRVVGDLRLLVNDLAVANRIHHGKKAGHGMGQRFSRLVVDGQLAHGLDR